MENRETKIEPNEFKDSKIDYEEERRIFALNGLEERLIKENDMEKAFVLRYLGQLKSVIGLRMEVIARYYTETMGNLYEDAFSEKIRNVWREFNIVKELDNVVDEITSIKKDIKEYKDSKKKII